MIVDLGSICNGRGVVKLVITFEFGRMLFISFFLKRLGVVCYNLHWMESACLACCLVSFWEEIDWGFFAKENNNFSILWFCNEPIGLSWIFFEELKEAEIEEKVLRQPLIGREEWIDNSLPIFLLSKQMKIGRELRKLCLGRIVVGRDLSLKRE